MKRLIPLLLALLLLLAACGTAQDAAEKDPVIPPESQPALPDESAQTPSEGPEEYELPILSGDELLPAEGDPTAGGETVTLDGVSSYLRVDLPEGWVWEQAGGTEEGTVYGAWPENDPEFKVELHWWPDGFPGMCGTGATFQDYTLPDGQTATLAYERIGEDFSWILILPESPDSFTIQFTAPYSLYETHRAELEQLLATIRTGVRAEPDVASPAEEVTG